MASLTIMRDGTGAAAPRHRRQPTRSTFSHASPWAPCRRRRRRCAGGAASRPAACGRHHVWRVPAVPSRQHCGTRGPEPPGDRPDRSRCARPRMHVRPRPACSSPSGGAHTSLAPRPPSHGTRRANIGCKSPSDKYREIISTAVGSIPLTAPRTPMPAQNPTGRSMARGAPPGGGKDRARRRIPRARGVAGAR